MDFNCPPSSAVPIGLPFSERKASSNRRPNLRLQSPLFDSCAEPLSSMAIETFFDILEEQLCWLSQDLDSSNDKKYSILH